MDKLQNLRDYVMSRYGISEKNLQPNKDIESDLKIVADEAVEFIDDIFTKFNVECEEFNYKKYFSAAGFGFFNLALFKPRVRLTRLTYGQIEQAVLAGRWVEPKE